MIMCARHIDIIETLNIRACRTCYLEITIITLSLCIYLAENIPDLAVDKEYTATVSKYILMARNIFVASAMQPV